ncbi:hypothetical protein M3Y97_00351500 [Aphelenchoides bicaudatus]|nr:hypothetical protein M3Y97_00351500 [Aphelenchoides bicaudatus]
MALSQSASVDESEDLGTLDKYRDAFVRNYKQFFTQFSTEEQRIEAANQLFNTVKTPSELAKIALTLKLITVQQPPLQQTVSKSEEPTLQRSESADIREKPAQNKLAREIESINNRIQELFELRKLRELNDIEQDEMRNVLIEREELRKKLKKTQDAAIRAKRYRVRKATLLSTDSDFGSLDTAEPAFKFSRSQSTNVLMTSDADPQILPKNQLTVRITGSGFSTISRENSICLTATPTTELSKLNISPALSTSSIKLENISPGAETEQEIIALARPSSVSLTDKNRISTTEEENASPPIHNSSPECQQCGASFNTLNEFIEHMRLMHINNSTEFQCRVCDRSFTSQQDRLVHMLEHFCSTKATYLCQKCDKSFATANTFRQHFAASHTDLVFRCNVCFQVFTDNGIYQEHILTHAFEETNIECAMCCVGFESHEKFIIHIQQVHERPDASDLSTTAIARKLPTNGCTKEVKEIVANQTPRNLKCFVCDERFGNEFDLDRHRLINHCKVPKSDRCAVCRSTLLSLEDFFAHTKEHCTDLNEVSCVICRQTVRNESLLKLHGEYHLSDDAIQQTTCQICTKPVLLENLAAHILQHTFEASTVDSDTNGAFVCQCGEKFEDAAELQIHSLVHLKEVTSLEESKQDSFICSKCSKTFSTLSALQGHSHIHINRKFQCKQCRQCFSSHNRLQSHLKRHSTEKQVKCQICDKLFQKQELLSEHMKIHESKLQASSLDTPKSPTSP